MTDIRDVWFLANRLLCSARQNINQNLHPLNLSSAEGNVLLHLFTQGQVIGQEQLVEQLDISKPAVSRALDSLEAKGYVIRLPDPADRRAHQVQLTETALEVGPAVVQVYNQVYQQAMQGISQAELDEFLRLFARISENFLREHTKKSSGEENAAA